MQAGECLALIELVPVTDECQKGHAMYYRRLKLAAGSVPAKIRFIFFLRRIKVA